jgi:hypothetical protein
MMILSRARRSARFATVIIAACGGRATGTSTGGGSGSGTIPVGPSGTSSRASSGVASGAGMGTTNASGSGSASGVTTGSASGSSAGTIGGSSASDSLDAGNADGGSSERRGVTCGTATCNPPEDVCCFDGTLDGGTLTLVLTCQNSCPMGSGGFACTGPQNCFDGQRCCAPTGGTLNAQCTLGTCAGWQFCQSNADCSVGDTCFPVPPTGIPNVSIMAGICEPVDASLGD